MDETIRRVEEIIKRGIPTQHVVINASKVNLMEKDLKLRKIVNLVSYNAVIDNTRRSSYMFEYSLVGGLVASGADATKPPCDNNTICCLCCTSR